MRSVIILALFCLVGWSTSQKCPARYLRFTPQHTFCLPQSQYCHVTRRGVSPQDIDLILRLHNQFRSKTAMGNEHRAKDGSLPQAADMMQMEWDDELAAVAQKWTENCQWKHDCEECKAVENFGVGQNLAKVDITCSGYGCSVPSDEPDWTSAITGLYDEVLHYYVGWLDSFISHSGPMTGHLTQLIWSRSWRIGCGYSFFKHGGGYQKFYACNYGPLGNVRGQPVYKQGRPCSGCPTNTQCSTTARGPNTFPGLCKMNNPNTAPIYSNDRSGLLFHCSGLPGEQDCQAKISGDGVWKAVSSVGGSYDSIVLSGGQSATLTFNNPIKPHGRSFCLSLNFRKGPLDSRYGDASSLKIDFKMERSFASPMELQSQTTSFEELGINIGWGSKTTFGFTFSVPRGAGPHVFDLRKVEAYDGQCDGTN